MSSVGAADGPVGAGIFFDEEGTYQLVLQVFVALVLGAAVLSVVVKRGS